MITPSSPTPHTSVLAALDAKKYLIPILYIPLYCSPISFVSPSNDNIGTPEKSTNSLSVIFSPVPPFVGVLIAFTLIPVLFSKLIFDTLGVGFIGFVSSEVGFGVIFPVSGLVSVISNPATFATS